MTSSTPTPTLATAPPQLSAKPLRQLHSALVSLHSTLTEEQILVERIWYKSHAQFRGQSWFQGIDAVRKCLREVLGKRRGYERRSGSSSRRTAQGQGPVSQHGQLVRVAQSIVDLYCHLSSTPLDAKTLDPLDKLPRVVFSRNSGTDSSPPPVHTLQALLRLLQLLHLLTALQLRCRSAFEALLTHLKTPPAPTFAPVVLILMSVVANIENTARTALAGQDGATPSGSRSGTSTPLANPNSGEAKAFELIKGYHFMIDSFPVLSDEDPAKSTSPLTSSTSKKRKRSVTDISTSASPSLSSLLQLTRLPVALQKYVDSRDASIADDDDGAAIRLQRLLPRRLTPHPALALASSPNKRRNRRRVTRSDGLPALKYLNKQRRTLLEEYEKGGGRGSAAASSSKTANKLLEQFSNSASSNVRGSSKSSFFDMDGDDEDLGLAV